MPDKPRPTLVTGATGYIGGRLAPRLVELGHRVRCMARHPEHLEGRHWPGCEVVRGDALEPESLARALEGVESAYYLIHSMTAGPGSFAQDDEDSARAFADAARAAGVRRIVYLGGLGSAQEELSEHLRCRQRVGDILRSGGVPVTEFRAPVIVGSGSLSFEMIRHIVEQHPIIPRFCWLKTRCQPIAVRDVLNYLTSALTVPAAEGRIFEIGGAQVLDYEEMLRIYAQRRGLKRWFVPMPAFSPALCALWIEATTPIPAGYALPLVESMRNEVIVRDDSARRVFPFEPFGYETAVRYALLRISEGKVPTTWTMAMFPRRRPVEPMRVEEGLICEERRVESSAPPAALFKVYSGVGGERGWLFADWLWRLRAILDRLGGGIGMRRGRRHPDELRQGEPLDFWRVERLIEDRLMLLRAEMFVPGKAWLQFESSPRPGGRSLLRVTAFFEPRGLWGRAYWAALVPLHKVLLEGLAREVVRRAEALPPQAPSQPSTASADSRGALPKTLWSARVKMSRPL